MGPKYEQETIINYNEAENTASVYTHNKALRRKLDKLAQERPEECRLERVSRDGRAVDYIIPKGWVKVNPSRRLSDEQRAVMAERMKANLSEKAPIIIGDYDGTAAPEGNYISCPMTAEKEEEE